MNKLASQFIQTFTGNFFMSRRVNNNAFKTKIWNELAHLERSEKALTNTSKKIGSGLVSFSNISKSKTVEPSREIRYCVVQTMIKGPSSTCLENSQINTRINNGWKLHGAPNSCWDNRLKSVIHCQAMTKA